MTDFVENQEQTSDIGATDDFDFFEEVEKTQPETEEVDETHEDKPVDDVGDTDSDDTFVLKHLGEERTVTKDEMTELAQKGLDYDRIRPKYDESKGLMEKIGKLSEQAGVTPQEYLDMLEQGIKDNTIEEKVQALMEEELITESQARRVIEAEYKLDEYEKQKEVNKSKEDSFKAQQKAMEDDFVKLINLRPQLKENPVLNDEVIESIKNGMSPVDAYLNWENKENKLKIEQLQQEIENFKKNPQSLKGGSGGTVPDKDDFLEGFL